MATLNHAAVHPPAQYTSDSSSVLAYESSATSLNAAPSKEYVELPAREVFPELDPRFEPTYRKFRAISICSSIVLIIRVLILGFLCFPWALKCFLNFPNASDADFILYQMIDIESFIIPEALRDESMIRYVLAFVFPIDLGVCISTSIVGLFIRNIAWSSFLCILWLCFILITFVIYFLGVLMFFLNDQYFTIFYFDMILLPLLMVLLVCAIRCLRVWGTKGYKRFVQPYKVVVDQPPNSKKQDPEPASRMQTHAVRPVATPQPHPHHHHPSISFHPNTQPIPNPHRDYNQNDHFVPRKSITPSGTTLESRQSSNISRQDAPSGTNLVSRAEVNMLKQDAARIFGNDAMQAERRKSRIILEDDANRLERRKSRMLEDDANRLERRKSRMLEDDLYHLERRKSRTRDDSDDYHHERRKSRARDDSDDYRYDRRKSRTIDDSDSSRDKSRRSKEKRDHHKKDRRKSRTEKSKKSKHHRK